MTSTSTCATLVQDREAAQTLGATTEPIGAGGPVDTFPFPFDKPTLSVHEIVYSLIRFRQFGLATWAAKNLQAAVGTSWDDTKFIELLRRQFSLIILMQTRKTFSSNSRQRRALSPRWRCALLRPFYHIS